jgi:uncharacterized membrane protein
MVLFQSASALYCSVECYQIWALYTWALRLRLLSVSVVGFENGGGSWWHSCWVQLPICIIFCVCSFCINTSILASALTFKFYTLVLVHTGINVNTVLTSLVWLKHVFIRDTSIVCYDLHHP